MVCRRAFILFIVLLLTAVGTLACTGPTPTPPSHFTKWGDSIEAVAVAPDGTVWISLSEHGEENFATSVSHGAGVARFDGQTWTTYTYTSGGALAGKLVSPIVVTPEGVVWFGTIDGAVCLAEETWTTYTARDGLAEGEVAAIAVAPDGAVWFGTWGGVSRFTSPAASTRGTWTTYTTEDGLPEDWAAKVAMIEGLAVAPDGVVWAGTDNDGVSRFDGQAWTTYTEDDGLADNSVKAVAITPDGTVWFGTHSGVSRYDGKVWTTYTQEHGLAAQSIRSLVAAPDSTVWVSYYDWTSGVSHFDDQTWTTYTEDDGLSSNLVTCMAVAPGGALWVGTGSGTISRFTGKTWTTWRVQDITSR